MTDRVVEHPWRYKLTPVSGTSDTYDLEAVPGTVTAAGTDLNKANLLTDATASALAAAVGGTRDTINAALAGIAGYVGTNGVQIATGSYAGTGTYGSANKNSLAFSFEPKMVIVYTNLGLRPRGGSTQFAWDSSFIWGDGQTKTYVLSSGYDVIFSRTTKTLIWYSADGAAAQLNITSTTYYYVAIG